MAKTNSKKITYSEPKGYFNADMKAAVKKVQAEKKKANGKKK